MSDTLANGQPALDYTPHGYLDNPWHSAVMNRSGVLRSVPPLGFGYWCRRMPWPYGEGPRRVANYLSLLHIGLEWEGVALNTVDDFKKAGVRLSGRFHSKLLQSVAFERDGVQVEVVYALAEEHALLCAVDLVNRSGKALNLKLFATNEFGHIERAWWGGDGVSATQSKTLYAAVAKIWAGGDVFLLGADRPQDAYRATNDMAEWQSGVAAGSLDSNEGVAFAFPGAAYSTMAYHVHLEDGASERVTLCLTRGMNERYASETHERVLAAAAAILQAKLDEDSAFWSSAPTLDGDWPEAWQQGWVYDYETLRMTAREPLGIYKHHWDGMQIYTPRAVLGEAALDAMALSYADVDLAKDMLLGTFADAPAPNVPCSREDGSMNMIGMSGAECGTAPIWGLPFLVARSIYRRDQDDEWLAQLYPYLKAFLQWWEENRTDDEGWFHCDNSWESGQDGSKRFLIEEGEEGKAAWFVRTVDVEAAMAHAYHTMAFFASRLEVEDDWMPDAKKRIERTRSMFADGWFRDFDGRTNEPIVLPDYMDVMMVMPLAVGIATPEQAEAVRGKLAWFRENPTGWLEWPSFMQPFTEAAWNCGETELSAEVLADVADRVYGRSCSRDLLSVGTADVGLPEHLNYRVPGVSGEFWPIELHERIRNGAECYGWGATFPTLLIRNLLGFRETAKGFFLAPTLPERLLVPGNRYVVRSLRCAGVSFDATVEVLPAAKLRVTLSLESASASLAEVRGPEGDLLASGKFVDEGGTAQLAWECPNAGRTQVLVG